MEIIAHVKEKCEETQPLSGPNGHLEGVAELAAKFAGAFGSAEFAKCAGLLHDLGKFKDDFQSYIRSASGYDCEEDDDFGVGKVDHSAAGAIWANKNIPGYGLLLAYLISGHHTGLPDYYKGESKGNCLNERLSNEINLQESLVNGGEDYLTKIQPPKMQKAPVKNPQNFHLWVRMLFSCLVDADFLDTERFMTPENYEERVFDKTLNELKVSFDSFMAQMQAKSADTPINKIRKSILQDCTKGAQEKPGLFSLTVPTGGGKTLASMGFALEHALKWNKSRIIVAIPYTSIIEQTADVYRKVFGENAVLEHHSNLDPDRETTKSKLASENWDAPIVVTTNVQLLESLFAVKTSRCRKLHNIANSVIILDEAQMLPPEYLKPILSTLESLTTDFNCSLVLCTATQPSLVGKIGFEQSIFEGLSENSARELMSNPGHLFEEMSRTNVQYLTNEKISWEDLAEQLTQQEQVLCIVNTRKDCKTLYDLMPKGTIHLSASMCGQHRSKAISEIKEKLKNGDPIRVISTQLVEAGVDIDFPVVYRAMAGMDSIAQAAGRCNREGKLEQGMVYVFNPPKDAPVGLLRYGAQASSSMLRNEIGKSVSLDPSRFKAYFKQFYNQVHSFDKSNIMQDLDLCSNGGHAQFRTAADKFKLIDDKAQKSVIVWYADEKVNSQELIEQLQIMGPTRRIMRKLQRCTVNIPKNYWDKLRELGYITEIKGPENKGLDMWQQATSALYTNEFGFSLEGPEFQGNEFIC